MCKIIVKIIITFPVTEKRLLKFGFKKTRSGFYNGQGVYVKDRHMDDIGNFSDTFYLDILSGEIIFSNVGNCRAPIREHVKNMHELKQFYEKHKSDHPYPDETTYKLKKDIILCIKDSIIVYYLLQTFKIKWDSNPWYYKYNSFQN